MVQNILWLHIMGHRNTNARIWTNATTRVYIKGIVFGQIKTKVLECSMRRTIKAIIDTHFKLARNFDVEHLL